MLLQINADISHITAIGYHHRKIVPGDGRTAQISFVLFHSLYPSSPELPPEDSRTGFPADSDICNIAKLMDKYFSWEWNFGRKIDFQYELTNKFSWGELVLQFNISGGYIDEISVYCDSMDTELAGAIERQLSGIKYNSKAICTKLKNITENNADNIYGINIDVITSELIEWFSCVEL